MWKPPSELDIFLNYFEEPGAMSRISRWAGI
jgi:hypothetical protein